MKIMGTLYDYGKFMPVSIYGHVGIILCLMLSMGIFTAQEAKGQKQTTQHRATFVGADGSILEANEIADVYTGVNPQDSLALVAYYHALKGDTWVDNSGWLVDNVDFWVGIDRVRNVGTTENPDWRVLRFTMPHNNMTVPASLPPDIMDLTYLEKYRPSLSLITGGIEYFEGLQYMDEIYFREALLTGEIPWVIFSELPSLERLELRGSRNRLTGEISPIVGDFPRLQRLNLSGSLLTGSIPQELANVETLERLNLDNNLLTGPIPDLSNLAQFDRLREFVIHSNNFDPGPIPDWLSEFSQSMREIRISNTNRTGTVPQWMTQMVDLRRFEVGEGRLEIEDYEAEFPPQYQAENMIGGELPDMSELPRFEDFRIYGPAFTGPFPEWIADIPSLDGFRAGDVGWEGPIPGELFLNTSIRSLRIANNKNLTGGLPPEMQLATNMSRIEIHDNPNMEAGEIPAWIGNLTSLRNLRLDGMGLTGDIPDEWANTILEEIRLKNNPGITGGIPQWFQNLDIDVLTLSRTGMDVPEIPAWLQSKGDMERLELAGLGIEGPIPNWLGDLQWLEYVDLEDNNLSGSIPASFGNLFFLQELRLANNQLEGDIPEALSDMGRIAEGRNRMTTFSVSGNEGLTGPIPMAFTDATYIRILEYDGTGLCEPDDQIFHDWLASAPGNANLSYPPSPYSLKRNYVSCGAATSVDPGETANRFHLYDNYPNPFNPTTTIRYEIPAETHVTLMVYNVIGQRVATLVNESQSAGQFEVNFDATSLSSGSYIIRLQAGDRSSSQTMMLIK